MSHTKISHDSGQHKTRISYLDIVGMVYPLDSCDIIIYTRGNEAPFVLGFDTPEEASEKFDTYDHLWGVALAEK
jgi:hypothetical protein